VKQAKKTIQHDLVTNAFVTRLWHRRWLNNQMRLDYEREHQIKYDWVIRTRFDIGYRTMTNQTQLQLLCQPPVPTTMYMFPDTFSCGSPEVINYESELINHWPYVYNKYVESGGRNMEMSDNYATIKKWLFMSEMNLIQYFKASTYGTHMLPQDLKIVRRDMVIDLMVGSSPDIKNEHITCVHYGCGERWIDVTENFMELFVNQYDNREDGSVIVIDNSIAKCDPVPKSIKNLVITTLEGNEFVYRERSTNLIKYQHYYVINCVPKDIKKVTYGMGNNLADVTKKFMSVTKKRRKVVYVSNSLSGSDPSPGDEKIMTITTNDGANYEFGEYSVIELTD
jgi:hypothetical protein